MTEERTDLRQWGWVVATCVALVVAAAGDAGPEIVASHSLTAGYDGPGPLICLGVAVLVVAARWRWIVPLIAVVMSALFLVGGSADAEFPGSAHRAGRGRVRRRLAADARFRGGGRLRGSSLTPSAGTTRDGNGRDD